MANKKADEIARIRAFLKSYGAKIKSLREMRIRPPRCRSYNNAARIQ